MVPNTNVFFKRILQELVISHVMPSKLTEIFLWTCFAGLATVKLGLHKYFLLGKIRILYEKRYAASL